MQLLAAKYKVIFISNGAYEHWQAAAYNKCSKQQTEVSPRKRNKRNKIKTIFTFSGSTLRKYHQKSAEKSGCVSLL